MHCVYDPVWGCTFCFEKIITVLPNPDISVPNFFTPNFDGNNDYFELAIGQDLEELSIEVYTRWGNLVYREVNAQTFKTLHGTVTVMDAR